MSEEQTHDGTVENIAEADRATFGRTFEEVQIKADGRNVFLFCAPFDTPALVSDPPPHGDGTPYQEEFARGAFQGATKAPNRVYLEFEHWSPGLSGVIGRGHELQELEDGPEGPGLYGHFRMLRGQDGDKALELIEDNALNAASVFFEEMRNQRIPNGIRRLKVNLKRVALCPIGAYPGAKVLAVRSQPEIAVPAPIVPSMPRLGFDPELAAAFGGAGFSVPERLRTPEDK